MVEPQAKDAGQEILAELRERAKELNCLYEVEEVVNQTDIPLDEAFQAVVRALPRGLLYPNLAQAVITFEGRHHRSANVDVTPWSLSADIEVQERKVGNLTVFYAEALPDVDEGPFLTEEVRLVNAVAARLGHFILYHRLREVREGLRSSAVDPDLPGEWRVAVRLLRQTDEGLYLRIARRLLNYLCSIGVPEAQALLNVVQPGVAGDTVSGERNVPGLRSRPDYRSLLTDQVFDLASRSLSGEEILSRIQHWMLQDKASFFSKVLDNPRSSLPEIAESLRRYDAVMADRTTLALSTRRTLRVSLTRRFLTEQIDFVKVAKDYIRIADFVTLLDRLILSPNSHGRLGGKGAGLILAECVLERTRTPERPIGDVCVPRTWYLASDALFDFLDHNDLQDVIEQKFKEVDQVRAEYPNIIQLFKNSHFPPEIVRGISAALDDLGDRPLVIRSSSLLEDRLGTAFSGKYKSLFVANQGGKAERMAALLDAIAEVYASTFSPDPIEYRRERGLLEFHEEMGVLIQEVVGRRVGRYFLPAFAGVGFSNNEFRWSPRIRRDDGLIRLVPGLGTRAVDRVPDDYPILVAPGQPKLRVNVQVDEMIRYSPHKMDVINLATNTFETVAVDALLRECAGDYPALEKVFSMIRGEMVQRPVRLLLDPERDELVVTFHELINNTPFVEHLRNIMLVLQENLGTAVDIEFAHDGEHFYLLQCRPQSYADDVAPAPIPKDVPASDIVFSADRYVSNGWLPDISHVVYVEPSRYTSLGSREAMIEVGRAVSRLNKLLPKRKFILVGPGRWGSRGDVNLGVSVTYADINNTAMLVEVARQKGEYLPDVSFGTHFFQDLVEARIRYLPLYPDDEGVQFNERFLLSAPNLLPTMVPEYAHLADVIRVIDVPAVADGRVLRVLLNADLDEALAMLAAPAGEVPAARRDGGGPRGDSVDYWRWRERMAVRVAAETDPARFGVVAMYLFGSTKNATAGPGSDIDLLVHFRGSKAQRRDLDAWLEGWSLCLAEMNYLRTGYRSGGLLDVHIVTDEDIANRNSYAIKIGAVTDPARELPIGQPVTETDTE